MLQKVLVVMGTFTGPPTESTVLGLVQCYSTEGVLVELALSSDASTTSCGAGLVAHLSYLPPQISALQITGFRRIMVAGVTFPKNTLRCQRPHSLKLQREELILYQFNTEGTAMLFPFSASLLDFS